MYSIGFLASPEQGRAGIPGVPGPASSTLSGVYLTTTVDAFRERGRGEEKRKRKKKVP